MFIDKFYRVYNPYTKQVEGRSHEPVNLSINNGSWDAKNLKINNVGEGEKLNDVSTLSQTLTRKNNVFMQGNDKFEFIELENNKWNARKRKICNVDKAKSLDEVPVLEQVLIKKGDDFIQGNDKYNLLELKNNQWDCKKKKLSNLEPATEFNQAVTLKQVPRIDHVGPNYSFHGGRLIDVHPGKEDSDVVVFEQSITLEPPNLNFAPRNFNAKNKKIINLLPGENINDAVTVNQIFKYDEKNKQFLYKNKIFKLMDANDYQNILIADPSSFSGFRKLSGEEFIHKNHVFKNESDGALVNSKLEYFTCVGSNERVYDK